MKNDSNKKRWLAHGAIWIALSGASAACGKTADVLTSHADAGTSGSDEDASAGGASGKGGKGSTGGGGTSGNGEGGAGGAFRVLPDGGVVLAPDGGTLADPHKEERLSLAAQFCALPDKYPCLGPWPDCIEGLNIEGFGIPKACWSDWVASMQCIIAAPDRRCPCGDPDLNECQLVAPTELSSFGGAGYSGVIPCGGTKLRDCILAQLPPPDPVVTGSQMSCSYHVSADKVSCEVSCGQGSPRDFEGHCSAAPDLGLPGGPYTCDVRLNDRLLIADPPFFNFYGDDCRSVAQAMANGQDGVNAVDCCFTWHDATVLHSLDGGPTNQCTCTSDPTLGGFATCAAAAAAGHGEVVDLCPEYVAQAPNSGGFPPP